MNTWSPLPALERIDNSIDRLMKRMLETSLSRKELKSLGGQLKGLHIQRQAILDMAKPKKVEVPVQTNNGYTKVANILTQWEKGDFDAKDAALELFSLPQRNLVDFIMAAKTNSRLLPFVINKRGEEGID